MNEPTHAPGWRGKPRSYADLAGENDSAHDRSLIFCVIGAMLAIGAAVLAFAADLIAGHL